MDRFDNMRVFAKVVESASFTGAAARLSMSASMVSQHVKELEERLGARLLRPRPVLASGPAALPWIGER